MIRVLDGHTSEVTAVAWSPDGTRLASGSWDRTVRVWEAASRREVERFESHTKSVYAVAWSPDGTRLASGSGSTLYYAVSDSDNTVWVWEAVSGRELARLHGHRSSANAVAWSPDGRYLASGSADGKARIWDVAKGVTLVVLPLRGELTTLAFHPSRPRLTTGNNVGEVWLGEALPELYGPIIVTATDFHDGDGYRIRCPICLVRYPLEEGWLGQVMRCPGKDSAGEPCRGRWRVNSFTAPPRPGA